MFGQITSWAARNFFARKKKVRARALMTGDEIALDNGSLYTIVSAEHAIRTDKLPEFLIAGGRHMKTAVPIKITFVNGETKYCHPDTEIKLSAKSLRRDRRSSDRTLKII